MALLARVCPPAKLIELASGVPMSAGNRTSCPAALGWVLTLPVCALLGALTFAFGLYIVLNVLGIK